MTQGSSTRRSLPATPVPARDVALAELGRVAASPALHGATRQVRLLRFLVGEVLDGRGHELTAAVVATQVFERPEGFDTTVDSIVRVETSKLRRALASHYALTGATKLRIELPRGSYAPIFVPTGDGERFAPDTLPPLSGEGLADHAMEDSGGPVFAILPFVAVDAVSATLQLGTATPQHTSGTRGRALAHGLTERLGALFARAPCIVVVSRVASLEEAAARGARYVLEGSVRLVPGALCVAVKLHDTRRWVQIWGSAFDRFGADDRLFAVEDEIAREIVNQLDILPRRSPKIPGPSWRG